MKTGLKAFDTVVGDLGLGELHGVAGRPSTGKTLLLLHLALSVLRRYETNVVFATAREFPEEIMAKAPASLRHVLVELPARDVLREEVEFPVGRGPCGGRVAAGVARRGDGRTATAAGGCAGHGPTPASMAATAPRATLADVRIGTS